MIVKGEIGIGDGWLLNLPEEYEGGVNDEGALILTRDLIMVMPQTFGYDASSVQDPPERILADLVEETRATPELVDLGPVSGPGWAGHLFREPIDPAGGEHQLLAIMTAAGTILNLAVRYLGADTESDALDIIRAVVHDPDTAEAMNEQLRSQMGLD